MERKELFQIGDVAKMFHISVGTLRHYEKIGLLQPEYIDAETGYRYYSTRQFECLNTIRYLRVLVIRKQKDAVAFLGKVGVGIAKEQLQKKQYGCYDMVFLILDKEDSYHGITEEIPEETCVTIRFCGSHKEAPLYYGKLDSFMSDHKLKITGFSKEITMIDYGITNDTSRFVTEIQIPITTD